MSAETEALVQEIIASHRTMDGAALPILHAVQEAIGYVPEDAIPVIAEALNISRAEMYGVVSFYHDFRHEPAGRHVLKALPGRGLPGARKRQGRGCASKRRSGSSSARLRADGQVTLEAVYCLGLCAAAPSAMLDRRIIGRLDRSEGRAARRGDAAVDPASSFPSIPSRSPAAPTRSPSELAQAAVDRGLDIEIVRNGSRGMAWLEPMLEVETSSGRIAYGPIEASDVEGLLDAGLPVRRRSSEAHRPAGGSAVPAKQTRLTFRRCGIIDPLSLDDYEAHGGLEGPETRHRDRAGSDIVAEVTESGLRGRGGAGFPTGIKWKTVLDTQRRPEIHRRQRRRGRLRHLLRPHDHGRRSLLPDRGHGDRRSRDEGDQGLHLYPLRIPGRDPRPERGDPPGAQGGYSRRSGARLGACLRHRAARRRRRLCLRRGDLAARQPRRQARPGARQAAAAGAQGPVRQADRHQQRHLARLRAEHPRTGAAPSTATSAWAARAAPSRSRSPAT